MSWDILWSRWFPARGIFAVMKLPKNKSLYIIMTRDDHDSKVDNDNRNIIYANSTDTMSQEKFVER